MQKRFKYSIQLLIIVILGLLTRQEFSMLPYFINEYGGDTLWAMALYSFLSVLKPDLHLIIKIPAALLISFVVEFSQLYHSNWIDSLRRIKIVGLILGYGFLWSDLICYTVGIGLGIAMDTLVYRKNQSSL